MRRKSSRWIVTLGLSVLVAMGLAACSDDKDEKAESTDTTTAVKGSPTIDITMADYSYTVSGPMTAGGTMKISNKGQEFHMMGVGKFKSGKTLADLQTALQNAGPPGGGGEGEETTTSAARATTTSAAGPSTTSAQGREGEEGEEGGDPTAEVLDELGLPGNFMGPGQSADLTVPSLGAGTYALVCFIPTEGEGMPHFAKGMLNQFEIVEGTVPAPTSSATYKVAPGKAIEGPATLTPGRHTLKFEAASGSENLEPGLAKLDPGTTWEQVDEAFIKIFGEGESDEDAPPPPKGAASQVPAKIVFGAFDLEAITTYYLATDFSAGDYIINAADTDVDDRPKPDKEVINIKVG
ncbi:MAG TPA: hypothetical protein VM121_02020 [Acidimicrobiales bacterium]|nr:hypothetical protein [Acidimicrobiales bacterium]